MTVLEQSRLREFETRALGFLAHAYPQAVSEHGHDWVRQLLRDTMEWTKTFGVNTEAGVVVCTELSLRYGRDFQTREPWAAYILRHPEMDVQAKVKRLSGYALG